MIDFHVCVALWSDLPDGTATQTWGRPAAREVTPRPSGPLFPFALQLLRGVPKNPSRKRWFQRRMGREVRHSPSTAWSAAATAGAVGTRPISPTPLMPNGERG